MAVKTTGDVWLPMAISSPEMIIPEVPLPNWITVPASIVNVTPAFTVTTQPAAWYTLSAVQVLSELIMGDVQRLIVSNNWLLLSEISPLDETGVIGEAAERMTLAMRMTVITIRLSLNRLILEIDNGFF